MNTLIHKSDSRGTANFGWLHSQHTFSFGEYYNPDRVNFGVLRVLNDDIVKGGRGFGTHPHANMEIVSIPLKGALEHRDSTGRHKIIKSGEVQIMSAGTGIQHSEYNASAKEDVNFLQIWILPDKRGIDPRYDQREYPLEERKNQLKNVVAPDNPDALWINQRAWFYLGHLEKGESTDYKANDTKTGLYLFLIEGELQVGDHFLQKRDAIGLTETNALSVQALEESEFLLMELRMNA